MRLNLVVEGQSEERFVKQVVAPYLSGRGVYAVARAVKTGRKRGRDVRGGLLKYVHLKNDLQTWMREQRAGNVRFSTMIDLYGLPNDFPGQPEAGRTADPYQRVALLEAALAADLDDERLIPYVQLHEFEALLLAGPQYFDGEFIDRKREIQALVAMAASVTSPELIDDGHATAPSKRIITEIPEYEGRKVSAAPVIASKIGLDTMRARCPHFATWLARLEALGTLGSA